MRQICLLAALAATSQIPLAAPLAAREPAPPTVKAANISPALDVRIGQLVPLLEGKVAPEDYFSPTFLAAVPAAQFKAISDSLKSQYGKPLHLVSVSPARSNGATLKLAFEKAVATVEIDVEPGANGKVIGLLLSGFEVSGDSIQAVNADFGALPGGSGFLLAELGDDGRINPIASRNPDQQFAIGSTFKLYILAQLASEIRSGKRQWNDVVPLSHHSFSSSATQGWPKDSPVTLHTLAGWMISVSDNGATDTLLSLLGREAVEQKLASIGHSAPDKTLPFLSTVEAFALKADAPLRQRFLAASEAQQRALLDKEAAQLTLAKATDGSIGGAPASIDTIEWFASPNDIGNLMRHLRLQRDDRMMGILAINDGLGAAAAKKWRFVGYKGGSEPGVISMSYLLQSPAGKWYVATGSWNDTRQEVDKARFAALMERLVALAVD